MSPTWNVFLCYRQIDGGEAAEWIYKHLHDCPLPTGQEDAPRLDVYFDQAAAAVANWKELHQPALERARALIMICTPGATHASGPEDYVHKEIQWWMKNRKTAPILVDTTGEGDRWIPEPIRNRWPDAQRLHVDLDAWARLPESERAANERRVVERISHGILLSEAKVRDEELERRRRTQRKLVAALAVAGLALIAAVAFGWMTHLAKQREVENSVRVADQSAFARALLAAAHLFPTSEESLSEAARVRSDAEEALERLQGYKDSLPRSARPGDEDGADLLLTGLVRDGTQVEDDNVLARLDRRFMSATSENADGLWRQTIDDIRATPIYGGWTLPKRQFGLWPLGRDRTSQLFEFAHIYSGSLPARDGKTGRLMLQGDAAIVFVLVPGGTFLMGAQAKDARKPNFDRQARNDESPVHEVTLSPFFLSKYECTQAQWAHLTGGSLPSFASGGDRHPVEQVAWVDCAGENGWIERHGFTLPTEAQWEYACRAPIGQDGERHPYESWSSGNDEKKLVVAAWLDSSTRPTGTRVANRFGLHDMHGNVWEWCQDRYRKHYNAQAETDPSVGVDGGRRVCRGGAWDSKTIVEVRSAYRLAPSSWARNYSIGVRPARPVER